MLSCLSFVGRMMFTFLPNVQPTTTIIILVTLYFGLTDGVMVATLSMLISNIYMGMGVWTIAQIVSYAVVILFIYLLNRLSSNRNNIYLATLCGFTGLLYGLSISLVQAPFFGWVSFLPYYLSGVTYDLYHAIGNFFFFSLLNPVLKPLLIKQSNRIKRV